MTEEKQCGCSSGLTLIFPCSGAADVGEISDRVARRMTKDGVGRVFCLAGIGGGVEEIIDGARKASQILVIDGCSTGCAGKTLERWEITDFIYYCLTDNGLKKGSSPIHDEVVCEVAEKCKVLLSTE